MAFTVGDRMTRDVMTATPDETLAAAAARMKSGNFRRLPVMDKGELVGIISEFDLKLHDNALDKTLVANAMTRHPITIESSETEEHAAKLMSDNEIGALPVLKGGKFAGIITAKDLMMPEPTPLPEWNTRKR
jgi:acetoin utilization protein AcuB